MTKFLIGGLAALLFVSGSTLVAQAPVAEETETVWVLTYTNGGG